MSASSPGAGSSTSVRSACSARSSLRYCTSSAWQRRQRSTWRASGPLEHRRTVGDVGQQIGHLVTPHAHHLPHALAHPGGGTGSPATSCAPGGGAPWPPTRRCRARRRSPRGAGRRRRGAPRPPAAGAGVPAAPRSGGRGWRRRRPWPRGRRRGSMSTTGASSSSSSWRCFARRPRCVEAQFAVMRYSHVVNCASPRNRLQASIGPQVRLLHHVPSVLLVSGQPVRERVRVGVRRPDQRFECLLVTGTRRDHQFGEITDLLWHTGRSDLGGRREVTWR